MKSSSRAGRFKKKLVSFEQLQLEAPMLEAKLAPYKKLHRQSQINDAEFCCIFIVISLTIRHPGSWLGAKRPALKLAHQLNYVLDFDFEPNIKKRLEGLSLGDLFNNFALKSTPEAVNRALLSWSTGSYVLELMFRIPLPLEVLNQQRRGRRCLTVITESSRIRDFILGERDYLSFTMHDLIHADHFYHHPEVFQGQLGFYGLLHQSMTEGFFDSLLTTSKFKDEFEYLISDMNAYAIHLLKCLKSAIIHYGSEEIFARWIEKFEVKESLLLLNSTAYVPEEQDHLILRWLNTFSGAAPY